MNKDVPMYVYSKPGDIEQYITPAGFQFLLLDMSSQVWFFMLQYLDIAEVSVWETVREEIGDDRKSTTQNLFYRGEGLASVSVRNFFFF